MNKNSATIGEVHSYQRWSKDEQTWGDSERRQNASAEMYCTLHKLPLPKKTYSDSGISAYRGKNRKEGSALAELLGVVKPNDLILIEDADRWSREDPITSLYEMRRVLKDKAISIHFLNENITVNQTNFQDDGIILPLFFKSFLGHREDTKKSKRIREVVAAGKADFCKDGKPYGTRPPSWLTWNKEAGKYEMNETKGKTVLQIFELIVAGMGRRRIAIKYNAEGVPTMSKYVHKKDPRTHGWNASYIKRIINNKAVLGYSHHIESKHKMYPPIPGMTEKLFYAANNKMQFRRDHRFYGRDDKGYNLFKGIMKCVCGKSLCIRHATSYYSGRGATPIKRKHIFRQLYCTGHLAGDCAVGGSMGYRRLEESFFIIMSDETFRNKIVAKVYNRDPDISQSTILTAKINDADKRINKYKQLLEKNPSDTLAEMLQTVEQEKKKLSKELESFFTVDIGTTETGEAYKEWNTLVKEGWDKYETRLKLRDVIQSLIERLTVDFPNRCYDVYFKANPDKPIHVRLLKTGFQIGGKHTLNFFWQDKQPTLKEVETMAANHGK